MLQMAAHVCRVIWSSLPRLWWGLLILIHLPVFFAVWSSVIFGDFDISRLGSGVALTAAMAFFLLKYRDVSFLRLRTRHQSFIAVCLLTAIAHHGVVNTDLDAAAGGPAAAVAVTTLAATNLVRRRRTLLRSWGRLIASLPTRPLLGPAAVRADHAAPLLRRRLIVVSTTPPRAPPA